MFSIAFVDKKRVAFCGCVGSCMESDKLPHVISLESVGAEDYKFELFFLKICRC